MRRYRQDPRWITARFASVCGKSGCDSRITKGERIFYYPASKTAYCASCGDAAARDFEAQSFDEAHNTCL